MRTGWALLLMGVTTCAPIPESRSPEALARRDARLAYQHAVEAFEGASYAVAIDWAQRCLAFGQQSCPCRKILGLALVAAGEAGERDPRAAAKRAIGVLKGYQRSCEPNDLAPLLSRLERTYGGAGATIEEADEAHAAAVTARDAGRHSDAIALAKRCVVLAPHHCPCERLLGELHAETATRLAQKNSARHYSRYLRFCPHAPDRAAVLAQLDAVGSPVFDPLWIDAGELRIDQPGLGEADLAFARELYTCVTDELSPSSAGSVLVKVNPRGEVTGHRVITGGALVVEAARRCTHTAVPPRTLALRLSRYGVVVEARPKSP